MTTSSGGPSAFTKMRQVYWEAKQSFNKSLGQREDSFIVSSDNDLDTRIELLQAADNSFNALMRVILKYSNTLKDLVNLQESLGLLLIEYGTKDSTAAGKIMCMSGKALSKAAQRQIQLKTSLLNVFHEVQTFQFKATADALQAVSKMEKVRKSYRSGLMWLKNESTDLDPDVGKKLRDFRKVQEHIKRLKVKFDGVKLESMQKIDLFLLSRSNLFSHTLIPYRKAFKKICRHTAIFMDYTLKNIPLCLSYNFVALKELNQYSKILQQALQKEQSSNKLCKKEMDANSSVKHSFSAYNIHSTSENSSSSKDSKTDIDNNSELLSFKEDKSSSDTFLIDLDDVKSNQVSTKSYTDDKSLDSINYSDDLVSINYNKYQATYGNELFTCKMEKAFEQSLNKSSVEGNLTKETGDLKFWSLIQSYDEKSNLKDSINSKMGDSSIACPKHSLSDSKWDEILIEFDPFLEGMANRKIKTDCLEIC